MMRFGSGVRFIELLFGRDRRTAFGVLVRQIETALAAVLCGLALAGCTSAPAWKEEVVMFDGSKIVVERQQALGNPLNRELSEVSLSRPPVIGNSLRVPLDGGGWSPMWDGPGLNPLALGRVSSDYYLAAMPNLCRYYDQWGRPVPPYVFFRFDGRTWQRIDVEAFPKEIDKLNMSLPGTDAHRAAVASGYVSAEGLPKLNYAAADYIRNIRRTGVAGFESCKRRLEASEPTQQPAPRSTRE